MLKDSMRIALARPGELPAGWVAWRTTDSTGAMEEAAEAILPDRVTIVRAAPGTPTGNALLSDFPDASALDETERHLARRAPLTMSWNDAEKAAERVREWEGYSIRIRFTPEHAAWVSEMGGRATGPRTVSSSVRSDPREAAFTALLAGTDELVAAAAGPLAGLDPAAFGFLSAPVSVSAVLFEQGRGGQQEPTVLASTSAHYLRWASQIPVAPLDAVSLLGALPEILCPDCGRSLQMDPAASLVMCQGPEGCGAGWSRQDHNGFVWLERTAETVTGEWLNPANLQVFENLRVPGATNVRAAHDERKAKARDQRQSERYSALEAFASDPELGELVIDRGMERGAEWTLVDGTRVQFYGPVRTDRKTQAPTAQVEILSGPRGPAGTRPWVPLSDFRSA